MSRNLPTCSPLPRSSRDSSLGNWAGKTGHMDDFNPYWSNYTKEIYEGIINSLASWHPGTTKDSNHPTPFHQGLYWMVSTPLWLRFCGHSGHPTTILWPLLITPARNELGHRLYEKMWKLCARCGYTGTMPSTMTPSTRKFGLSYWTHNRGQDSLPSHFSVYFDNSLPHLLSTPLQQRITWLRLIKTGCETTNSYHFDLFSVPGQLRRWIGIRSTTRF